MVLKGRRKRYPGFGAVSRELGRLHCGFVFPLVCCLFGFFWFGLAPLWGRWRWGRRLTLTGAYGLVLGRICYVLLFWRLLFGLLFLGGRFVFWTGAGGWRDVNGTKSGASWKR